MKKSRRIMNSLVLTVFLGSNFLTPISYAVGENEEVIEPSTEVTQSSETVDSNSDFEISEGGGSFNQNLSADQEEEVEDENTEWNEDIINLDNITDEDENNDNNIDENNEDENEVTWDSLPISGDESDNNIAKTGTNNTVLEHNNFFIWDEEGEKDSTSSLFSWEKSEVLEQSFTWENEELTGEVIKLNDKEIVWEKTYKNVTVKVVAPEKSFPEGTKLRINTIKQDKTIKEKENQLTEQIEEINEDTTMVSFDISFYNPENPDIELNPIEWKTVSVVFNYENNDELKEAAKDTNNSELKIYHLEEINDEWDVKPEELKTVNPEEVLEEEHLEEGESVAVSIEWTENLENLSNELEVQAESFSVYTIVVQTPSFNQTWGEKTIFDPADPTKWFTIMDRNLWATSTDITNSDSYGYKYQWWNNYWFSDTDQVTSVTDGLTWDDSYNNNWYKSTNFINWSSHDYDVWDGNNPTINGKEHHDWVWWWANDDASNWWWVDLKNYAERQWPCPSGWHVPSAWEWWLLVKYWRDTYATGVTLNWSDNLYYFSDSTARQNFMEYFNIPFAGLRNYSSAALNGQGSYGLYWSSSPYGSDYPYRARFLYLDSSNVDANNIYYRAYGFSVRCFKNSFESPETYDLIGSSCAAWYVQNGNQCVKGYTLSFNATTNGGTTTATSVQWTTVDISNLTTYPAEKDWYTFVWWNTDSTAHVGLSSITMTENTTVYAIFSKTVQATFNANWSTSVWSNSLPCTMWNTATSCTVEAPTITRAGWNILWWNTNANAESASVNVWWTITLTATTPYYAITSKGYTANFTLLDSNAATLSSSTSSCTAYNQWSCTISAPTLTPKSWYEVIGWSATNWGITETNSFTAWNTYYSITRNSTPLTATFTIQDENAATKAWWDTGCYKYNGATSCSIQLPTLTANDWYTVLWWDTNSNAINGSLASNSSTTISAQTNTYYSITKNNTPITITFNVNGNQWDNASLSCYKYNGASSCSITSPGITPVNGFTEIWWSTAAWTHSNQWTGWISKSVSANAEYFAQSSKNVSATFKANNNKIDNGTSDIIKNCTRYNGESTCSITTPTITANGTNTPTVVGYTTSSAWVSTASIWSNISHSIAWWETYFAHTKKTAVTKQVTFNPNGNTKFKYWSNAESTTTASYDLCTIAETYDGIEQASNCTQLVTCPKITASANTPTLIWWSEWATDRTVVCTSEWTATLEWWKTYYAQTKKAAETYTATFEKNGATSLSKYSDDCTLPEKWNWETRSETCNVIAPTITRDWWTKLWFNTNSSAELQSFAQWADIPLSSNATYHAITRKEAIDLTANVDGNNSTLSSDAQLTCTLEAVYNTGTQEISCEVTMPTVTPNTNTPNFIGWNTPSTSKTNNASYNTTTNKLTLTASNTNATWYAITNSDDKVLHITYEIWTWVASIWKTTDSCTLTWTYNWEAQATSCTVEAPSITVSEGYKDSDKKWTESGTNIIANVWTNITLTQDSHYTAWAKYIANTNPMDDLQYTIRYEDQNGKPLKSSDTIVNQTFWTAVTVTAPDIAWYITPSSQNITIAVTNSDVVFVYAPRTNIEYTVTYKDTNWNTLLTTKTVNTWVMDTEVSENAPEIDGYTVQTGTLSITLKATNNHIDFVYNPNNNISYTVYYKSWDVTLHTAKTVNNKTMAEIVTEYAENIPWYTVDENQKSLTLAATNNTITFNYTPNTNISYTVKYQTSNWSWLSEDKVVDSQTMASTVNEDAIEIVGYTVDEPQKLLTLAATNNVITFTYTPIEYAIRFVDESNIHPTIVRSWDYLSVVNQNYPEWTRPWYAIHWDKSIPETMPLEGLTITASWTANTYIVSFNANQSWVSNPENQSVTYDLAYGTLPSLSKDWYTFNWWKDWETTITSETVYTTVGNKTLIWDWTANTNTSYKIEHYKEKLDWTYEKVLTEDKTGETDTTATATPKTDYEGFTYSWDVEWTKVSGNIEWNGSLVLKLFYTRNSYDVEYQFANTPSGHSSLPATVSHKYGSTVSIAENATAPWYSFAWDRTESFTMPAEDVTITGTFTANTTTPYKVEYYYQQANGQYPTTATSEDTTRKWTTDQTASVTNEDKTPTESWYAFDAANTNNVLEWTIAWNESLVLKVYFKKQFTVRYLPGERWTFGIQTTNNIDYGDTTPNFEWSIDEHVDWYIFAWWSPSKSATVTEDIDYVAQWYEDFNHDGQNDEEETKYTVIYTDWVEWEEIFADQTTEAILSWTTTPAFVWTPTRENYVFAGWNPIVSTKVTANATYTAQWKVDFNHDGQADEDEDKYTVTITYVYSRGWTAAATYTVDDQLSWFTYDVESPSIPNYHADKVKVSGKITWNVNEVVTYTPNNDANGDGYADEWEDTYKITVFYNYSRWGKAAETQSWEYLSWINYSFTSPTIDYYTPSISVVSGTTTWTVSYTVIYTPETDLNHDWYADEDETPFTVTFLPWEHGTLWWTTEFSVLSWLKLSEVEWYQTPSTIPNTHYVFSGWSPKLNTNTKVLSNLTYTAIWWEDNNWDGQNDEFETKYTVTYRDWVDWLVFEDDIHDNILSWTATPTHANPTRNGFKFNGWSPAVAEKVTANATYTATWKVDTNNNWVADEDETYTLTINYVYSKWWIAAPVHTENVLQGAQYSVLSPNVTNYQTTDTTVSWTMPWENKTITVIYTPVTDANGNNVADEEEAKYTLTIQYHDTKWNTVYSDYIAQYVSWASYERVSQTKEHYTIISWDNVSWVMPANNVTLTVIYSANLDENDNWIADQNETHYTLTIHYINAQGWTLYPDYTWSYVAWAQYGVVSNTSDTHYTIESWKETVSWIMPTQNTAITVIYTAVTDANGNGIADEDEQSDFHNLTIHYKNSKWATLFPDYTASIVKWASYTVNSPEKAHYTIDRPVVSWKMGDHDIIVTVIYNTATADTNDNWIADEDETAHQLTITYKYSRGEQASETVTANYLSWISYSIASPIIANYTANITTVEWVMWDADRTIKVIYTPDVDENHNGIADVLDIKYTATVHYVYSRWWVAHADKTQQDILSWLNYSIISPYIEHYVANKQTVSWTITGENVEFTVTYTPVTDENHDGYADEDEIKYAVTYKDWADGSVFTTKVFNNILSWTTTPVYNGLLTRTDYLFSWWTPSIAIKVTWNATYTAQWKEDMNNNGIADDTEDKYTITIKDWDTIISTQEVVSWAKIKLPETPTKNGYTFDGWDGLPEDWRFHWDAIVLTAKWKQNSSNTNTTWWGGWWGGGSSSSSSIKDTNKNTNKNTDKNKNEKEHNSANLSGENLTWNKVEDKTITEENDDNINKNSLEEKIDWNTSNNQNNSILQNTPITNRYSQEVLDAYKWAYSKNITTMDLDNANPEWWLYRQHMAKMIVNFAVNVLGKEIPEKSPRKCLWKDWPNSFESKEMEEYALKACKLWLMWIDMDYFQPRLPVTRAQFGTILSRLLYGTKYAWWTPYYRKHLNALKKEWIMTKTDNPENRMELREWVWVMLMRVKDLEKN